MEETKAHWPNFLRFTSTQTAPGSRLVTLLAGEAARGRASSERRKNAASDR